MVSVRHHSESFSYIIIFIEFKFNKSITVPYQWWGSLDTYCTTEGLPTCPLFEMLYFNLFYYLDTSDIVFVLFLGKRKMYLSVFYLN